MNNLPITHSVMSLSYKYPICFKSPRQKCSMFASSSLPEQILPHPDDSPKQLGLFAVLWFGVSATLAQVALFASISVYDTFMMMGNGISIHVPPLVEALLFLAGTAVSGGLIGGLVWFIIVEQMGRFSVRIRGAVSGVVTAALSSVPILFWGFLLTYGSRSSVSEMVIASFAFALLGLVYIGWLTLPIGAVTGYILGSIRSGRYLSTNVSSR